MSYMLDVITNVLPALFVILHSLNTYSEPSLTWDTNLTICPDIDDDVKVIGFVCGVYTSRPIFIAVVHLSSPPCCLK